MNVTSCTLQLPRNAKHRTHKKALECSSSRSRACGHYSRGHEESNVGVDRGYREKEKMAGSSAATTWMTIDGVGNESSERARQVNATAETLD